MEFEVQFTLTRDPHTPPDSRRPLRLCRQLVARAQWDSPALTVEVFSE